MYLRLDPLLKNRSALFWTLQVGGWLGFVISQYLGTLLYEHKSENLSGYLTVIVVAATSGFLLSLELRYIYRRLWLSSPRVIIFGALLACYLFALVWRVIINSGYLTWTMEAMEWDMKSPLEFFSNALASTYLLLCWTGLYFGFKYFNANIGGLFRPEFADAPWSWAKFQDLLGHMPVPAIVLGMAATAAQIRIMRANLLDEKRKPYVVSARVRGLPEYRVILKYPVRVALNPFASTIGYTLPYIVSGSVIVSIVLSLPTVGPLLFKALIALDMFLAGTIILMLGILTVIGTLLSDFLLMWLDPRIRLEG